MELDTLVIKQAHTFIDKIKKQNKNWRKSFTKNLIAIDTENQVILACRAFKGPRHDPKDAILLIKKIKKYDPIGFSLDRHAIVKKYIKLYMKNWMHLT